MKKLMFIIAAVVISAAFASGAFASSFADTHGYSARGIARGNAMCAIVDDWSSVYYNMAGMGKTPPRPYAKSGGSGQEKKSILEEESDDSGDGGYGDLRNELGINYFYSNPTAPIEFAEGSKVVTEADQNLALTGFSFAMIFDINTWYTVPEKYISSIRFGFGIAMPGDGQMIKLNDVDLRSHDYLRYGREASRIVILAGLGLGFMDDMFGIGIGSNMLMSGQGRMIMSGMEIGPGEQSPGYQAKMDMGPKPAPAGGLYWEIGKMLGMLDVKNPWVENIKFGAAYRGEVTLEIDPFAALGSTEALNMELPMVLAMFEYYTPNIYTAGVAYGAPIYDDMLATISIDYEFQQWSRSKVSSARVKEIEEKAGVEIPALQDISVWRVGLGVDVFKWLSTSAGYYYQPSIVPEDASKGIFNFLDNDKHVLSAGLDFVIPPMGGMVNPMNLSIGFQYQILVERTVKKDQELARKQTNSLLGKEGADEITPEDWEEWAKYNPDYTYGGNCWLITMEIGLKW